MSAVNTQDLLNIDKYIEKLLECEFLPASDVKALCEKVFFCAEFSFLKIISRLKKF